MNVSFMGILLGQYVSSGEIFGSKEEQVMKINVIYFILNIFKIRTFCAVRKNYKLN